ncbi:disease resistance protein At4g27190 [Lactuca sativa]|uniref:disease resistance protein At4g27190 n=1 Tax=Lactuca sativa TaxID=4236 RepID=UPI000CC5BE47|nr:disease resistance protein At4g27190 [Lactuca sativa]XP_042753583.1 disease resistance protein At4g27190 [Lactuca sativa]
MGEEVTNTVVGKIVDLLFSAAKREIDYIRNYTKNIDKLKSETQKLKDMRDRIQQRIDAAKENGQALLAGVQNWMEKADIEISKVEEFLEQEANAKKTCFNLRPCVNLGTLHHYSKMSINKTPFLLQHQEDGQTYESCVSIRTPTPRFIDLYQAKNLDDIDTHKLVLREIIKAIKDESVQIVGIYGLGGVGKTTLAKEVAAEVKNLFADTVFITVSQTVVVKEIKKNVEVAAKRIINGEKVLIILDDIWETLVLPDVGIPCGPSHRNCKILLTSRRMDVCEAMNADRNICVNTLTKEEAWVLFRRMVGDEKLANDSSLEKIAREVTEECGGLPLIIQAVGNALKNKKFNIWEAALDRLRKHAPLEIAPEIRKAFTHLKLSYDLLDSKEAKSIFLLCSLFREDGIIDMLSLAEYGVGLQIFNNLDSFNDAEKRVRMAVDTLTSSSLLLSEGNEVKMHDVVRDVALLITSSYEGEEKEKFLVEAGKCMTEWQPRNRTSESYTKISLMSNIIRKLPDHQLHFPLLDTFLIRHNLLSIIPDEFFGGMKEVKVLDMSWNPIKSLPQSLKLLTKLITLDLSTNRHLTEICIVGELKDLEILRVRGTGIKVIPKEIGQLTNLRLLDAGDCFHLSDVTAGVISKLPRLEELYIGTRHRDPSRFGLMEISNLKWFRALHLSMNSDGCHLFPEGTYFKTLQEFFFQFIFGRINTRVKRLFLRIDPEPSKSYLKHRLHIAHSNFPFTMPIKKLFQVSDGILLKRIKDLDNIIPDLYGESTIDELKSIVLDGCDNVSCLVKTTMQPFVASNDLMLGQTKTTKEKYFSKVEEIFMKELKNLKILFDCSFQYISLRNLQAIEISGCDSLLTVFPLSVAQGLSNLRRIQILRCDSLMVVISGGDEQTADNDIEFPRLTHISLKNLPKIKSFNSGDSTVKYSSLEFIEVEDCPSMKRWGYGVHDMPHGKFCHEVNFNLFR